MELDDSTKRIMNKIHEDDPYNKKPRIIEEELIDLDQTIYTKIIPTPMPRGAEAIISRCIYLGKEAVYKRRIPKAYRCQSIDEVLTKERTKAEIRGLKRCKEINVSAPAIYFINMIKYEFVVEYIAGITLRDYLLKAEHGNPLDAYYNELNKIAVIVGKLLGKMHKGNLIHGDLTSANMILKNDNTDNIFLIDFGLSYNKNATEDKAVDLYVLEKSLHALHNADASTYEAMRRGYEEIDEKHCSTVYKKLEEVRLRGRKRNMVG